MMKFIIKTIRKYMLLSSFHEIKFYGVTDVTQIVTDVTALKGPKYQSAIF